MKTSVKTFPKGVYLFLVAILSFLLCVLSGCGAGSDKPTKLRDLEFTIISEDLLPEELKTLIEERKTGEFKITYTDTDALYICVGYGEQSTGGYSIAVDDLYLAEDSVYIGTSLLGPSAGDTTGSAPSYPFLVVKTELLDKTVIFD
ncbi:MAG: protease complex subunit PrcB family protein [Lachnospiraceae bacterium]|nr:protease complex subunit PrcB family protein [Lachnospiraceae bacterium]